MTAMILVLLSSGADTFYRYSTVDLPVGKNTQTYSKHG